MRSLSRGELIWPILVHTLCELNVHSLHTYCVCIDYHIGIYIELFKNLDSIVTTVCDIDSRTENSHAIRAMKLSQVLASTAPLRDESTVGLIEDLDAVVIPVNYVDTIHIHSQTSRVFHLTYSLVNTLLKLENTWYEGDNDIYIYIYICIRTWVAPICPPAS